MDLKWTDKSVLNFLIENNGSDPISLIKNKVRKFVLMAFNEGWDGPPYDPVSLAKLLGITVMPNEELRDAKIIPLRNNKFRIEYNPERKKARINFSIAHEIGHTFFSDCSERERNRDREEYYSKELELLCDIAASEILLPYADFTNEANSVSLNLDSLIKISEKYQASLTSVFLRFCEVVNKSCAIMIASFDKEDSDILKVDYYKTSLVNNLQIIRGFKIPEFSKALECINPGWTSFGKEQWEIFGNTLYNVYSIGLAPIKFAEKRVGIFLVPEFYNETPENRIYTIFGDATKPRGKGNKIIVQIVNTYAAVGTGFGKAMKINHPVSYKSLLSWKANKEEFILGNSKITQLDDDTYVYQIIAQKGLFNKNNETPLSYVALKNGLQNLAIHAISLNATVHMPLIGAGQAKGDWKIIEGIIYNELVLSKIQVTIYLLPGTIIKYKPSMLTLFNEESLYDK